jgi:class 3 adenylate cyclase
VAERGFERRLAAILVGDAQGFTRLIEQDDEGTVALLAACRDAVHACVDRHRGRVMDDMGDDFFAEFASAVDAVRCALELQRELSELGASSAAERRMSWLLAINVGDVIADGNRLYGAGLNVAHHLVSFSEPGGLVISGTVLEQVEGRLQAEVRELGPQNLRGVRRPVHAHSVKTGFELPAPPDARRRLGQRRLSAVLNADIAGFSRLMAADQDATVSAVNDYRRAVTRAVEAHRGTVLDFTGDEFLAEFRSALESVECALEIQAELGARNAERKPEERVTFRIGAHLGDLRTDGGRRYGNAINIAARLQGMCAPGGICISGIVREQLRGTLDLELEDLGEQQVKNIPDPLRVYRVHS